MTTRKRKSRRQAMFIDRLASVANKESRIKWNVERLKAMWPDIESKCDQLRIRMVARNWTYVGDDPLPAPPPDEMLDEQEVIAMFSVLRDLMETPATDSTRRDSRDEKIAADFVFHRDLLHHEIVMPGVCARWDVTESVVKKAVSRCREQAYAHIQSRQESWEYFSEPGIAKSMAERGVPIDGDFHSMLARELRQDAEEYRAASKAGALPRKRRNRGD